MSLPDIALGSPKTNATFRLKTQCAFATPPLVLTSKNLWFTSEGIFMQYSLQSIWPKKLLWICELDFNETNSTACVIKHLHGMFTILICFFDFTSIWFSWTFLTVYYTAGFKRHLTALNHCKRDTLLSWHVGMWVKALFKAHTYHNAKCNHFTRYNVGGSLKLSLNESNWYCTSMLATITSVIVPWLLTLFQFHWLHKIKH